MEIQPAIAMLMSENIGMTRAEADRHLRATRPELYRRNSAERRARQFVETEPEPTRDSRTPTARWVEETARKMAATDSKKSRAKIACELWTPAAKARHRAEMAEARTGAEPEPKPTRARQRQRELELPVDLSTQARENIQRAFAESDESGLRQIARELVYALDALRDLVSPEALAE